MTQEIDLTRIMRELNIYSITDHGDCSSVWLRDGPHGTGKTVGDALNDALAQRERRAA